MTVLRNLPEQLILAHTPWLYGAGLIICIIACLAPALAFLFSGEFSGIWRISLCAAVPLALFVLSIKRNQVIFDARAETVIVQRRSFWRYDRWQIPLADVFGAELEMLGDTHRPVLRLRSGLLALIEAHQNGPGPDRAVREINAWLARLDKIRPPS